MPLPVPDSPWPLPERKALDAQLDRDAAWYSGDRGELSRVYGREVAETRPSTIARLWGRTPPLSQRDTRMHVPVPADLASMSADLLFADPPSFTVPLQAPPEGAIPRDPPARPLEPGEEPPPPVSQINRPVQDRLDAIEDSAGIVNTLHEGAEVCAALGGVGIKVDWSRDVADSPTLSVVHADDCTPEYVFGTLVGVLVHRDVARDGARVWRYFEYHRSGGIELGYYEGTTDNVGRPVPLTDQDAPAWVRASAAGLVDGNVKATGTDLLTCRYIPNMRPQRAPGLRKTPYGRSDFYGLDGEFDAIDDAWSSWTRDVRLAKARLMIPAGYLEQVGGRGQGATFDTDRELFTELNMPPDSASPSRGIQLMQPEIRFEEHRTTVEELVRTVLRSAGYSAQTFGLGDDVAMTATEVAAKERRSLVTRGRKVGYWRPELRALLHALLQVDRAVGFPGSVDPGDIAPEVEFGNGVNEGPLDTAQTLGLLSTAQAISTYLKVKTLHPDWDDRDVLAEVDRIKADNAPPPLEDPTTFGGGPKSADGPPSDDA